MHFQHGAPSRGFSLTPTKLRFVSVVASLWSRSFAIVPAALGVSMKHVSLLVFASLLFSLSVFAQDSERGMHAPDGGVIEQFNSILLPPVPHAPFTSTVTAEWTKVL